MPGLRHESWGATDVGRKRQSNEDAFGRFPDLGLFVVADGLGGHSSGEVASRMAVDIVRETVAQAPSGGDTGDESLLSAAIQTANERITASGSSEPDEERRMASTAVALLVRPGLSSAAWAHVGDSRLYVFRGGRLSLLTADHTAHGIPYATPGTAVPLDLAHSNRLLQALGVEAAVIVATGSMPIATGDVFLLCSDGLSSMVPHDAITAVLGRAAAPEETGKELIDLALEAGGEDNTTVILVRMCD